MVSPLIWSWLLELGLLKRRSVQPNHLMGYRRTYIQLSFNNISDLMAVRKVLQPIAEANKKKQNAMDAYMEVARFESPGL